MNNRLVPTLIMAACLTGILAPEICAGAGAEPVSDPVAAPKPERPPASRETDPEVAAKLMSTVISRPLFSPTRRPAAPSLASSPTVATTPPVKLVGTIVSDWSRVAFLEIANERVTRLVGDRLANAEITAIDPTRIVLRADDGQTTELLLTQGTRIGPVLQASLRPFHMEQ